MNLVILIGPPGSGKSTFAKTISDHVVEADSFPGLYQHGILNPSMLHKAHVSCQQQVESLMRKKTHLIVQSNTNLDKTSFEPYLTFSIQYGYSVRILLPFHGLLYYQGIPRNEQTEHIIIVRSQGDKIIPRRAMERMINQFYKNESFFITLSSTSDPNQIVSMIKK